MAYTSGIFHIDLVSGSDAARTALTTCTASNPSGSTTRINKTAHGLVTGAVVDLTAFTTWLNDAWKITVVDADNFDLDSAVWQATADPNGTVTPRGGMNWADAWKTIATGATAARIQPGDEFRISKTPGEVSLGQDATWTDGSATVTLTTAVSKKIEDAISGWTASANITAGTNTSRKIGATALLLTPSAPFTTGKVAYSAISGGGTQDFSAYQKINFFFRSSSGGAINAGAYEIRLCSDATGDVAVNSLALPAFLGTTSWSCVVLDNGGNLGNNIQSVALYAITDPSTNAVSINNIFATTGDFSLKTLMGKTGDVLYNIQSVDGTTIKIDSNNTTTVGRGYSGATSTETLYYRVPIDYTGSAAWALYQEAGDANNSKNHYSFGWDTVGNVRNGDTLVGSTCIGVGVPIQTGIFNKTSYVTFARFTTASVSNLNEFDSVNFVGGANPFSSTGMREVMLSNVKIYNVSSATTLAGTVTFINCQIRQSSGIGLGVGPGCKLINCTFANNTSGSINYSAPPGAYGTSSVLLKNCLLLDATEISASTSDYNSWTWMIDHDQTPGNNRGVGYGAIVAWQTAVKQGSDPGSWIITNNQSARSQFNPILIKIAEVAVAASSLVTVKAWVKKDHATNIAAKLVVQDALYSLAGIVAAESTKASDTNWEELTITFTPSVAGVVPIFIQAWYVAGLSNVYVGSITATQS